MRSFLRARVRADAWAAAAVALLVTACAALFRFPGLNPETWNDVAAAAGLRPPAGSLGGLVRGLDALLFRHLPPEGAFLGVRIGGFATAFLCAFLSFLVLKDFCGDWVARLSRTARGRLMTTVALATGAVAFVFADAPWYAFQGLSATGLQLVLALAATRLLMMFVRGRLRRWAFLSMGLWALLAGDTPVGLAGAVATAVAVFFVNRIPGADAVSERLANPLVRLTMRRFLLFIFAVVFVATVVAECGFLRALDGYGEIAGTGLSASGFKSLFSEWKPYVMRAATWKAWILLVVVAVAPLVVARLLRDRSIDEEDFLPLGAIVAYALIGAVSWTQLAGFKPLWFVNWFDDVVVKCPLLSALVAFLLALTLVWTMLVLGAAVFLKNPRKVAFYRYADAAETADGKALLAIMNRIRRTVGPVAASLPLVIVATIVPFRAETTLRGMLAVTGDYLAETVDECLDAGVKRLFTDGFLDAGLELEAFRRGARLRTVALMSGNGARDVALRTRGLTGADDLKAAGINAYSLLGAWVADTPERLADAAVQLGFELWRGKSDPPVYLGTIALPPTNPAKLDVAAAGARARELSRRVLALYEEGSPDRAGSTVHQECLRFVQWRLSRLGAMRASVAGLSGWNDAADEEQRLVDGLNGANRSFREMNRLQGRGAEGKGSLMTPREGLRFCLRKVDFKSARQFAETVIVADPADPEANFALGMDHFLSGEYSRAEPYLKRCLEKRPDDPAVLNNLGVIELRIGRYDEAEQYSLRALDRLPGSPQIKRTLDAIRKARTAKTGK